jgi:hypothetical protein
MRYKLILENVSTSRGAPMGRHEYITAYGYCGKVHLNSVPFVDCAYDKGGAYWECLPICIVLNLTKGEQPGEYL